MFKHKVLKIYRHNAGKIWLSEKQAARRRHLLETVGGGCYLPKGELCFKVGEEVGLDFMAAKGLSESLLFIGGGVLPELNPTIEPDIPEVEYQPSRKKTGRPRKQ